MLNLQNIGPHFRRFIEPKRIILVMGGALFIILIWSYYKQGAFNPAVIQEYKKSHPIGALSLYLLIYAISVVAALPSMPLNLAAGYLWGGVWGGIYATAGVTVGGWISFLAARLVVGQPMNFNSENQTLNRIQSQFKKNGWKFVVFIRLNPILPTGPLNYLLGMTSLSHKMFICATFFGLLAPSIAVAYIGDVLQTFTVANSDGNQQIITLLTCSAIVTIVVAAKLLLNFIKDKDD